jgi:hypothetical protein
VWSSVEANLIADVLWLPAGWILIRVGRRLLQEWREAVAEDRAADREQTARLLDERLADHRAAVAHQLEQHSAGGGSR